MLASLRGKRRRSLANKALDGHDRLGNRQDLPPSARCSYGCAYRLSVRLWLGLAAWYASFMRKAGKSVTRDQHVK